MGITFWKFLDKVIFDDMAEMEMIMFFHFPDTKSPLFQELWRLILHVLEKQQEVQEKKKNSAPSHIFVSFFQFQHLYKGSLQI